jgi:hypothetical protein
MSKVEERGGSISEGAYVTDETTKRFGKSAQ